MDKRTQEITKLLLGRTIAEVKVGPYRVELVTDKGERVLLECGIKSIDEMQGQPVEVRSMGPVPEKPAYTADQIDAAIKDFLQYGEDSFVKDKEVGAVGQAGYFSGPGWAASCLRYFYQLRTGKEFKKG